MSNEMKDWIQDLYYDSYEAISKIASIYDNYKYTDEEAMDRIGQVLKDYRFID